MLDQKGNEEDFRRAVANMRKSVADVAHPRWSPSRDLKILVQRQLCTPLDVIAAEMGLEPIRITARWHVLRTNPRLAEDLNAYIEVFGDTYEGLL